ncbi:cytochrome c oxidase assembly protein subunit 15 [Wenyingzhuangia heitensis]|uniref:Cytochrome c oxidase assembly protein subunit 15 n=1 Tax=Wenyingzhuangia heitensis TaxID=1487859 RepID=A0ABX0U532_9FLAO|nr:COX15/CtaA family protein [Wenyingzhuangia heitensis]NIJ43972.1 cytochrome c oxidase assembly protein subunit 15 [Wenyingzhuangia heitensis]
MNKSLIKTINVAIVSVYLIFLAGSVVRMTGSGMGCPDWPKCFGYYIPPTSQDQLEWKGDTEFKKGAIIIHNEALYVAKSTITTDNDFKEHNWEVYTKHEYAEFNVYHTYTEYINRLSSVVAGFVFLVLLWKVTFNKNKIRGVALLTYLAFVGMLFEAWLGKVVVDSYLTPYIITIHMIGGLLIIGLLLRAKFLISSKNLSFVYKYNKTFHWLLFSLLLMMIVQILLGTQVRQFVDEQVKEYGFEQKEFRLLDPNFNFYFHRSFTIVVVLVSSFIFWLNQKYILGYKQVRWILAFLFFEAFTGILMYYVHFPFGTQAIHLLSGALLFGVIIYSLFISYRLKRFDS